MVTAIKTTIDIADTLLYAAKEVAACEHTTLRALVEEGQRLVLVRRRARRPHFRSSWPGPLLDREVAPS